MKLADWANVAEVLSGIAVVVTLIVLAVGVRDNSATVRAATYADMLKSANEFENQLITDPAIREIFFAGLNGGASLTDSDRLIFGLIMQARFREKHISYTMRKYGQLDEGQWPEIEESICSDYETAATADVAWALRRLSEEFAEYIRSTCSE